MSKPTIYSSADQIDFKLEDLSSMPPPNRVLMVEPTYFDVEYVINPHMADQIGMVDTIQAYNEWQHIKDAFENIGLEVITLEGVRGLPDMVFTANQSLPYIDQNGDKFAVMSRMHAEQRREEVAWFEQWYRQDGYEIFHLDENNSSFFEGMGDAIWHPRKKLLWGGYGVRTSKSAYEEISRLLDVPVILLHLVDERFYHLDTCFSVLNESTVMIYPDAFDDSSLQLINSQFDLVIEATQYEAVNLLAVNATCPDGKNVLIQQGCTDINKKLRNHGFQVHELSTYEFLKSGGSVFCMKLLLW